MTPVADYVLQRPRERGVERIYDCPGDGINGLLGAFDRAQGESELVQARHVETAAFTACAHARFTGEVGCCMATAGPGAVHVPNANGLYDAELDHQPVVAVVGRQKRLSLGAHHGQEMAAEAAVHDPERAGVATRGVRQKLTEVAEHLSGRHS